MVGVWSLSLGCWRFKGSGLFFFSCGVGGSRGGSVLFVEFILGVDLTRFGSRGEGCF